MAIEMVVGHRSGDGPKDYVQLATANGLTNLGRWVGRLDADEHPDLHHLIDHGWSGNLPAVAKQVQRGLAAMPPKESVRATAEHLLDILDGRTAEHAAAILSP